MATRNLSSKYASVRANSRTNRAAAHSSGVGAEGANLDALEREELGLVTAEPRPNVDADTPQWVTIHENIVRDLANVKENIRSLQKLHAVRLKVSFGEGVVAEQQSSVDNLTNEITSMLRRCEGGLKQIATIGNDGTLTSQERTTRLNVMRSLGTEMAQTSKAFRHIQKEFFRNLSAQEKVGEQFFSSTDGASSVSLEDAMSSGLTESQMAELQQIESRASDREKEIIRIAQSVNELANLFKELNMLVIEQGTVLDRIDYNIETSLTKIQKGVVHLEDAEKISRKALATKCVLVLAIVVLLLFIVFIIKKS